MAKILGLDLGTNSIGWAIRNTEVSKENQIVDDGVLIFQKGVGDGKSGEFSLAAERRDHRSKRRLYNAKRYRKWATLKVLIENNMCPLSDVELDKWRKYKKEDGGRNYPTSPDFTSWLRMDFDLDGKLDYTNPYELRCELLEKYNKNDINRLYKIGRAFYHLVQRRGFKTSRKNDKTTYADNILFKKFREKHPDKKDWKPSQIYLYMQSKVDDDKDLRKERIRNNQVILRDENLKEFNAICCSQKIDNSIVDKIYTAIYFVRPLRTQKGLVGKCTLEKGKSRIPISHPLFEEFRAISFVNNLKWRKIGTFESYEQLPISLRKEIFEKLFFRVSKPHFKFDEIIDDFSNKGDYEFNYRNKPNVSACPIISRFKAIFKNEWENPFVVQENKIGIDWSGLSVAYKVKYGKKIGNERKLDFEDLWHLLFDYFQTKDKVEDLEKFLKDVVGWDEKKIKTFSEIDIQQGYGSLSKTAINKILPYLQKGYIYSEAVSFANLNTVLGEKIFEENKDAVIKAISQTIFKVDYEKEKLNIVNGLIQQFFGDGLICQGNDYQLTELDKKDIETKLKNYFGSDNWEKFNPTKKSEYIQFVTEKYLSFIRGTQPNESKASYKPDGNKPKIDYYKLPRLDEAIKQVLKENFEVSDAKLKKLYHPSDIEIYPVAKIDDELKVKQLGDPMPPSKGWKNPMAMRTMHELKKLVNYLLEIGKIDEETKIVVEMARELNDANKRWAIQTYQRKREEQNIEFAKAIIGVAKEKYPNLNENDADNIDKVRLWWEQLENGEEIYKQVKALKEDVQKYRLWKEQECQCMYTGKMINLTDLFDGTQIDFEHTLPVSSSFDNSLANLTVCDSHYNRTIKIDRIPFECGNYEKERNGYSAIEPRLKKWKEKVESLKDRIEENKIKTKRTQDVATKNDYVQKRHLLLFEFDYWNKKVKTFTVKEVPNWWKNSQLVDTQIISKYARAYMKSLFKKVDVQKGNITAEFRKIYGIMGDEKKDRSKHSHHAIDAAVLTLIPGSANREAILKEYYKALEQGDKNYHKLPYVNFHVTHVKDIENNILINHISKDQTLADTKKNVRKRGRIVYLKDKATKQYLKDEKGNRIPMIMQGDSIRGQLHKETFFGAVKAVERNENGFALKDEQGKYIVKQSNGEDEIWIVARKPIGNIDIEKDIIVDEVLKQHIKKQLNDGKQLHEIVDFNSKIIRHIRCRVKAGRGVLSKEKALTIKKHSSVFLSKHIHKQEYLTQNEENYLYLLYEGLNKKNEVTRGYRILNLFDIAELGIENIEQLKNEPEFMTLSKGKGKNIYELKLKAIIKVGQKILMWQKSVDELKDLSIIEKLKRIYKIYKFNEMTTTGLLYLQHHIEARPNDELGDGETLFNPEKYQPRLKLTSDNFNCLIEHKDFKIKPDGEIEWLF